MSEETLTLTYWSFIVLELHRLLALVRFAHLCWWKTDGTVTSVSRVANTSCWKFSLLILRFQFIALPPAMLTASLTVRGQSSVRGNFRWSKQNPKSMSENISLAPNQLLSNVRSFYWPSPVTSAASLQRRVYLFVYTLHLKTERPPQLQVWLHVRWHCSEELEGRARWGNERWRFTFT